MLRRYLGKLMSPLGRKRPHVDVSILDRVRPEKKGLIDHAFRLGGPLPRSFADLGGVWGVEGAYTFYTLSNYDVDSAVLVDTDFTETVRENGKSFANLRLVEGDFGTPSIVEQVGDMDLLIMFDVLLHQANPDWDTVLKLYLDQARCVIVYNQQWTDGDRSVRLVDLGRKEYFRNVPHTEDEPGYDQLFTHMNEVHPESNRPWRDLHGLWQWGITDHDLLQLMETQGFDLGYRQNFGPFGKLTNFEDHGFLFQKRDKS